MSYDYQSLVVKNGVDEMAGCVVSVAQNKGGVGKSTLAAQLAIACSRQTHKAQIVDTDPQGTLIQWAALREQLDMEFLVDVNVQHGSAWRLPYILQRLSQEYDILFVDGPSGRADDFKAMEEVADLVLIPCQPTALDLWATKALLESHRSLQERSMIVLNRMPPRGKAAELIRQEVEKLSWPMARQHIGNRQAFASTMGNGLSVTEVAPSSLAGQEISALAAEIVERLSGFRLVA